MLDKLVTIMFVKKFYRKQPRLSVTRANSSVRITPKFSDDHAIKFVQLESRVFEIPKIIISDADEFVSYDHAKFRLPIFDDIVFLYGFGQSSPHHLQVPTRTYNMENTKKADYVRCLSLITELKKINL
uniref:Uncharacterized protein n=1 Tax=Rhabditophanes sp. KR3021 TaxID=114890 RepID=A0AC35U3U7_9BILA